MSPERETRHPIWVGREPEDAKYWRGQVWPRRALILGDRNFWFSIGLAALGLVAAFNYSPLRQTQIKVLANAEITVAGIAYAASVTGAVLALSILPKGQRRLWSEKGIPGGKFSHYSELIFVFSWSGMLQLAALVYGVGATLTAGEAKVGPPGIVSLHAACLFSGFAIAAYALFQLFAVLLTISQIGVVVISEALTQEAPVNTESSDSRSGEAL